MTLPSAVHPFRFGDLPPDLVRTVFETSAEASDHFASSISCLSKEVKLWVEPILYRHIRINDPRTLSLLHRTITSEISSKSTSFFRTHVRSIYVVNRWIEGLIQVLDILSACSSVTRLGTIIFIPPHLDAWRAGKHDAWKGLRPTRISINPCLFTPTHRHFRFTAGGTEPASTCNLNPLFTNVTHLEISWIAVTVWSWPSLPLLTSLPHLCIAATPGIEPVDCAVRNLREALPWLPPALVVCVLALPHVTGFYYRNDVKQIVLENGWRLDPRVVVAVPNEYYKRELMKGSDGVWIKGEVVYRWDDERDRPGNEDAFWEDAASMVQRRKDANV
ncbi:hypothetical protein DFP72DRAFT_889633 [Ephemerocybe angulata]|uniref:Uncharacterized protein n=1 Tax=Ephemerocybe angulata TaxID=980116 RepID=A0A8H6I3J5_9AGAR|nr:hypothetical protein DFP72DRAFT_889633 [Tulosesus angulatus]